MTWFGDMHFPTFLITSLFWGLVFWFLYWYTMGRERFTSEYFSGQLRTFLDEREALLDRFMALNGTLAEYKALQPQPGVPEELQEPEPPLSRDAQEALTIQESLNAWINSRRPGSLIGNAERPIGHG